jgi:hypothetical protein
LFAFKDALTFKQQSSSMVLALYLPSLKKSFNGMMIYRADMLGMDGLTDKLTEVTV